MRALFIASVLAGLAAAAAEDKPNLMILVSVSGARVELDGKEIAAAASQKLPLKVAPGKHKVRVRKEGFQPWEGEIAVSGKELTTLDVLLKTEAPPPAPLPEPKKVEAPRAPRVAGPVRVAVYEFSAGKEIEPRVARLVTEALLAEVRKLERVSAISMKEIQDMLSFEQQRQLLGCGDESCLAEIGGALGVDELLSGNLAALGDQRQFVIKRIDMKGAQVKGAFAKTLVAADGEEFLSVIGPSVEDLFKEHGLREGRKRGVSPEVAARLNPPPLPRWAFFSTAGAALAAVGVGAFFGLSANDAAQQHQDLVNRSKAPNPPVAAVDVIALEERVLERAKFANIGFAVAGGLALAAGIEALFTNWAGTPTDEAVIASVEAVPMGIRVSWR